MTGLQIWDGSSWRSSGAPLPPGNDWPDVPDVPMVSWESVYTSGETVRQTLAKVPAYRAVTLPSGFEEEFSGFSMVNNIAMFFPNIIGFIGLGSSPDDSVFRLARNSMESDKGAYTSPGLTLMRLMDGRQGRIVHHNWHLQGTDQHDFLHTQGGGAGELRPSNYAGLNIYYGRNAFLRELKVSGVPGNWNSPPGETFQINCYKDIGTRAYGLEVSGINVDGQMRGGSPYGCNNSVDNRIYDCNFHDAFVSGLTFAFAGTEASPSTDILTYRTKVHNNANHSVPGGGKRFTGINHENVTGKVVHDHVDFKFDPNSLSLWDQTHIAYNNYYTLANNLEVQVIEPTWEPGHPFWNGCFVIEVLKYYGGQPNAQTTWPTVIKNGVTLNPIAIAGGPSATNTQPIIGGPIGNNPSKLTGNPATTYYIKR